MFEVDDEVPTCRGCGCTDERACPGGCCWVEDPELEGELCSTCLVAIWNGEPLPLEAVAQ